MSHAPLRVVRVDTDAIAANTKQVIKLTGVKDLMVVVKANGYGHGMIPVARAALAGGATWLGVADIQEALRLRDAGITAPILCWIHAPGETFDEALAADITIGASSVEQLSALATAAQRTQTTARVHLKLDTGLSRNGASSSQWAEFFERAATLQAEHLLAVEGVMSHLSNTSAEENFQQLEVFTSALELLEKSGLIPRYVHLAASEAALTLPETRFNMVRSGIAIYGIAPREDLTPEEFGLVPAMTFESRVVAVREVPAGVGVSYGYTYRTSQPTRLALVPLGYGDGVNRDASNAGPVVINGTTYRVAGRIAMDQFVVDVGDDAVEVGDTVVLFGNPQHGAPSVHAWAQAANSIGYEIVTRLMGSRLEYVYTGAHA